jgi:probable F420-dependent oxidoreductase
VKVGVILPAAEADGEGETPPWQTIRSFALAAEACGLDSVWMFDHFFNRLPDGTTEGMHEAWTIVSAVAAVTERIRIGTLVMCASFRSPALLAKMAATVDAVSDGRLILGLGAGWHDPEYEAFGFPIDHRVDRFDEALQIVVRLLRGETVTFHGRYHVVAHAVLAPAPGHRVPVHVAAFSPRMLRLAARHADGWNTAWFGVADQELREHFAALDAAIVAEGRDPRTLERTVGMNVYDPEHQTPEGDDEEPSFAGSVDELAAAIDSYEALGVDHLIVLLQPMTETSLERLAGALERRATP